YYFRKGQPIGLSHILRLYLNAESRLQILIHKCYILYNTAIQEELSTWENLFQDWASKAISTDGTTTPSKTPMATTRLNAGSNLLHLGAGTAKMITLTSGS